MATQPKVLKRGALDMQVCVPKEFTDEQVKDFADLTNPCGTSWGWVIRKEDDPLLAGNAERTQCTLHRDCVHIMLDA